MRTEDIPTKQPSLWIPERDPATLAAIGKLGEEACELGAALFRAAIQGIDGLDPETGRPNREKIADEIADVRALSRIGVARLGLDDAEIEERAARKVAFKEPWLKGLDALGALRPMDDPELRRDRTSYLLLFKGEIPGVQKGSAAEGLAGLWVVARHHGKTVSDFDLGWSLAGPFGRGGFPDDWFVGWRELPDMTGER
jgi:hypothetical protein